MAAPGGPDPQRLFLPCGCVALAGCTCRNYAGGCGACPECERNRAQLHETGVPGARRCRGAPDIVAVVIAPPAPAAGGPAVRFKIEYPRALLQRPQAALALRQARASDATRQLLYARLLFRFSLANIAAERGRLEASRAGLEALAMRLRDEREQLHLPWPVSASAAASKSTCDIRIR